MSYLEQDGLLETSYETEVMEDFDDDDEAFVEFDDDDDESYMEFDDDDDEVYAEFDDDDDESYVEFDDDDDEASAEIFGTLAATLAPAAIGAAIKGVKGIISKRGRSKRKQRAPRISRRTARGSVRINPRSRLHGRIRGRSGRSIPFRLPRNIALKSDVMRVAKAGRKGMKLNGTAIKKNAKLIANNIAGIRKVRADLKVLDKKHSIVSNRQNKVLTNLNKRITLVSKEVEQARQQAQMQAMFSLILGQPDLQNITVKMDEGGAQDIPASTGDAVKLAVTDAEFDDGNNFLPLLFAGGMSGGSGGGLFSSPMGMFAMMQMLDK